MPEASVSPVPPPPPHKVGALRQKLLSATALNVGDHAVRIASAFVISPLLIKGLGTDAYGMWVLVLSYVFYLEILDLGLTNTTVRFFSTALGSADHNALSPLFYSIRQHYRRVGVVIIALSILGAVLIKFFSHSQGNLMALLFVSLGLALGIAFQFRVYTALLKAHLKYNVVTLVSSGRVATFSIALVVLRFYHLDLYKLVTLQVSLQIVEQLSLYFAARRLAPPRLPVQLDKAVRRDLTAFAGKNVLANAAAYLRDRFDTQLLAAFASLAAITQYSVGVRIPLLFLDFQNSLFGGHLLTAFGINLGRKTPAELREDLFAVLRLSAAGALTGGILIFTLGPPFIDRWLGPGFQQSHAVLQILIPGISLVAMQYPAYTMFAAANRMGRVVIASLTTGILNFIASFILVQYLGVTGVVWGTGVEFAVSSLFVVPALMGPIMQVSPVTYALRVVVLPLYKLTLTFGPIAWFAVSYFHPNNYPELGACGLGLGCIGALLSWLLILGPAERSFFSAQFAKYIIRKRVPVSHE